MKLLKGLSRSGSNWTEGNDIGVVFATTDRKTAKYYAFQFGEESNAIAHFEISDDSVIADLHNKDHARQIVERMARQDVYYAEGDNFEAMVDELVSNSNTDDPDAGHMSIMDDDDFRQALFDAGFIGARQGFHIAFYADEVEISNVKTETL